MDNLNLFHELEAILRMNSRYCMEDGTLIKNKIVEDALSLEPELLKYILRHEGLKKIFFCEVNGVMVFDKVKFQHFVMNKSFLPDSYTSYKNKIGLTTDDGSFISESRQVVLAWPYKDCILEGGQTKEDAKRDEIFWSETLAPDEINRLTEPKAFVGFKRYDKDGEHEVEHLLPTDNLIIKGNNLLALYSLREKFANKIKLIYIDPPYNTGNDGFGYNDNFNHSSWLSFMRNRLMVARDLLSRDGLIFISIDTSRNNANGVVGSPEMPYLHIILDEIFGRKNFIGHLHWKKKKQPSFLSRIAGVMESILIYAKDESNIRKLQMGQTTDTTKRIDNADNPYSERTITKGIRFMGEPNYVIKKGKYQNKTMTTEFLQDVVVKDGRTQNDFKAIARYRTSQSEINKFCSRDLMYITANCSFRRFKTKDEMDAGKTITDLLLDWGQNQDATEELRKLFDITNDEKAFDNPKPELLMSNIILVATEKGDIVLDYHLGSGTTAAVAQKLERQYIGVEQMEYINTLDIPRLQKVIEGEQGGISKSANWQGGGSFVYCELAKANQQFVDEIKKAKSHKALVAIWQKMQSTGYLNYKINVSTVEDNAKDFESLSFDNQKRFLIECLDKNLLYIPVSDMESEEYAVSDEDIRLTKEFYKKN